MVRTSENYFDKITIKECIELLDKIKNSKFKNCFSVKDIKGICPECNLNRLNKIIKKLEVRNKIRFLLKEQVKIKVTRKGKVNYTTRLIKKYEVVK